MTPYQDLRKQSRVDLASSVPLPAPLAMFVEPTNVCNMRCGFCPEGIHGYAKQAGYYQRLPLELWRRVVEDLKGWCVLKSLKFYDLGEPMLNPNIAQMIAEANAAGITERTELTTNGSIMSWPLTHDLVDSGLHYLRVSVYGTSNEEYRENTGASCKLELIQNNIRMLRETRETAGKKTPHIFARYLSPGNQHTERFREQWTGIADELGVEPLHNWGGSLVNIVAEVSAIAQPCPQPFYTLVVKANGDVSACCLDWNGSLTLGNLGAESLRDIWAGHALRSLQEQQIQDRSQIPFCRDCNMVNGFPDDMRGLTLPKFQERFQ